MPPRLRDTCQAGFSLIELIMVLLLLGIIGVGLGLGISHVVDGFMTSRESAAVAAKGQLALLRLSREFRVITSVTSATATSITFVALHGLNPDGTPDTVTYTVSQNGDTITLDDGEGNNDTLVDQVSSLALAYYDTFSGSAETTWSEDRSVIQVTIVLNGPDDTPVTFNTRVTPRNI